MLEPIPIALLMAVVSGFTAFKVDERRFGLTLLAFGWLLYSVYEFLMYKRVLCTGECNIRVDLLLIYPVILGATIRLLPAVLKAFRGRREASEDR